MMQAAELWDSADPKAWENALARYLDFVPAKDRPLERSLDTLDREGFRNMDAQAWYDFRKDKYFRWKFTDSA